MIRRNNESIEKSFDKYYKYYNVNQGVIPFRSLQIYNVYREIVDSSPSDECTEASFGYNLNL